MRRSSRLYVIEIGISSEPARSDDQPSLGFVMMTMIAHRNNVVQFPIIRWSQNPCKRNSTDRSNCLSLSLSFRSLSFFPSLSYSICDLFQALFRSPSSLSISRSFIITQRMCTHFIAVLYYGNTSAQFCQHQLPFKSASVIPRTI